MSRGVYRRPSRLYYRPRGRLVGGAPPTAYNLTADQGSYTLTGANATLTSQRSLTADQGSYSLAGADAGLTAGASLTAAQGAYTLTGADATLTAQRSLTADQGAYTLTGADAGLNYGNYLAVDQGSYTLTGADATLTVQRSLTADQGSYTLTGADATLTSQRSLTADQGSYTLTGATAALTAQRSLTADQGSYTLTGADVTFTTGYGLVAAQGSYTLTGAAATLTAQRQLVAAQGSYVLTGADVTFSTVVPTSQEFPSWVVHFEKTKPTQYRVRAPPEPNEWPPSTATAAVYPSFVTHFEKTRNRTNRQLQLIEHDEWRQPLPTAAVYPSFVGHFEKTRNQTNRRIQTVRLDRFLQKTFPADRTFRAQPEFITRTQRSRKLQTPPLLPAFPQSAGTPAAYPGYNRPLESNRIAFKRRLQEVILTGDLPRNAPVTSLELLKAHRISFRRRHQTLPKLDVFPAPPTFAAVPGAFPTTKVNRRKSLPPSVVYLDVIVAVPSAPLPVTPGLTDETGPEKVFRRKDSRRKALSALIAPVFPPPPTFSPPYPSYLAKEVIRTKQVRTRRDNPVHVVYPRAPLRILAFWPNPTIRRKETKRRLQVPLELNEYPPTPPSDALFISAIFPSVEGRVRRKFSFRKVFRAELDPVVSFEPIECPVYVLGTMSDTVVVSAAMRDRDTIIAGQMYGDIAVQGNMTDEVIVRAYMKDDDIIVQGELC